MSMINVNRGHDVTKQRFTRLSENHPKIYTGVALLVTLIGYLYLFFFPLLAVEGIFVLLD